MFGQTFDPHDLIIIGLLVVLEGVLSIDNALVLGLLAKRVPKPLQKRALTYGLIGALVFRMAAIGAATWLLQWTWAKLLGGAYLIYVALKHFIFDEAQEPEELESTNEERTHSRTGKPITSHSLSFWYTVVVIELTDIAFAIDSILAAIALVGNPSSDAHGLHPKFWVIVTGGMLGVVLMRVAAILFIKMLERFPRFETAAYLLVALIGVKLLVDWWFNKPPPGFPPTEVYRGPVDFHSPAHPAFWVFWGGMLVCFCVGFIPRRKAVAAGAA